MTSNGNELILKEQAEAAAAPFLFSEDDLPKIDKTKQEWNCTGEYLKKLRPDIYEAAVTMLLEPGLSLRMICRTLHVSHNTLASIQERENLDTETRKKAILKTITRGLRVCAERVEELAPEMEARDAIIATGVLSEKMLLLGGEPTARIEIGHFDLGAELRKLHEQALEAMKQAKAQVVDGETGLDEENFGQKVLTNVNHERACAAQDDVRIAVAREDATSGAEGEAANAGGVL